jgi:hypothetical protein
MLTTPRAILLGLGFIAAAVVVQPIANSALISPARADSEGALVTIGLGLIDIGKGIRNIRACRD